MAAAPLLLLLPAAATEAVPERPRVRPCGPGEKCVSTASFQKPSQYAPPWIVPETIELERAGARLGEALEALGAENVSVSTGPGGVAVAATASGWGEEMLFVLAEDEGIGGGAGVVTFTVAGAPGRRFLNPPDPPGCLQRGCINGPVQRRYVEALRDRLQWQNLETDEDKRWVQLLLH